MRVTLSGNDMRRLEQDARRMASDNARAYLADTLECIRETGDPVAALELLRATWLRESRVQQRQALEKVGNWLAQQHARRRDIETERLVTEIGWLRRMCTYLRPDPEAGEHRPRGHAHHRARRGPEFGEYLDRVLERRRRGLERVKKIVPDKSASQPAAVVARAPTSLPARVEVRLVTLPEARAAWKKARERQKKGKAPKDRLLAVQPIDAELRPLARDIHCSLLHTQCMDELFARTAANHGHDPSFWITVAELEQRDDTRVAPRIEFM